MCWSPSGKARSGLGALPHSEAGRSVKHIHVVAHASRNETGDLDFVGAVMDVTAAKGTEDGAPARPAPSVAVRPSVTSVIIGQRPGNRSVTGRA